MSATGAQQFGAFGRPVISAINDCGEVIPPYAAVQLYSGNAELVGQTTGTRQQSYFYVRKYDPGNDAPVVFNGPAPVPEAYGSIGYGTFQLASSVPVLALLKPDITLGDAWLMGLSPVKDQFYLDLGEMFHFGGVFESFPDYSSVGFVYEKADVQRFQILNLTGETIPPYGCIELVKFTGLHEEADADARLWNWHISVGTEHGIYWGAYKPFKARLGEMQTCGQRKFAFNGPTEIAANEYGYVTRATGKPTRCLLDPRLFGSKLVGSWESDLCPVPDTFYVGCGDGYRFTGAMPGYKFDPLADPYPFDFNYDDYPQGFVIESGAEFDPTCPFAGNWQCIDVTLPAITIGAVEFAGGTFKLRCCVVGNDCNLNCAVWEDSSVAGTTVSINTADVGSLIPDGAGDHYYLDPTASDPSCQCKRPFLRLDYKYGGGADDKLVANWLADKDWLEQFNGNSQEAETLLFEGINSFAGGATPGTGPTPADVTITRDFDCDPDADAPDACGTPPTPPACADNTPATVTFVAATWSGFGGMPGCVYYWTLPTGLFFGAGANCYPLDPCDVCGPPTSPTDTCTVDVCTDGPLVCDFWHFTKSLDEACRGDCPDPPSAGCYCGPASSCLFEAAIFWGADTYALGWVKMSDCSEQGTFGDIPGLTACTQQCTCPDALEMWGPPTFDWGCNEPENPFCLPRIYTYCFCPDDDCPQFGQCGWLWLETNEWSPCQAPAPCNCPPDQGCLSEPPFSGSEVGEIAYTDCEDVV